MIFGREAQSCDFVLGESFVSRAHAAFEAGGDGRILLRDLNSRQGTFVNGQRVAEHVLADGDLISFGPGEALTFRYGTQPAEHTAPVAAPTAVGTPVPMPPAPSPRAGLGATQALAEKPVLRIGRAPENDIVLESGVVSRHHATLTFQGNQPPVLTDLGSTNGTFVNGQLLREPRALNPGDLCYLGGFLLRVEGRKVHTFDLSASRITAQGITQELGGKAILRDVTLVLHPREFVGLMGPSGCGKSTLLDALNGLRPAMAGSVYFNHLDLYQNFNALRQSIGYVPQRDNLHDVLTVERTLYYAAKLRLPEETPHAELMRIVNEVIETVALEPQRQTQFRQLSGGQQKRLSLAIELITKPSFLFLDEPTSPLDPETTESMMLLFRKLADQGRIVVMVTHKFEKFFEMHQVAILARGGHLAFFGPPRASLEYFQCAEPAEIYHRISGVAPEELAGRFRASPQYEQYVRRRAAEARTFDEESSQVAASAAGQEKPRRPISAQQWWTQTRRFVELKLKDKRNTALLLAQAPIIALLMVVITGDTVNDAKALFISAVVAIWFGANNAIRDIVAEAEIYVRERRYSLKIPSYVLSKFVVLGGIGLIQVAAFLGILMWFERLRPDDFVVLFILLYLTTLGGITTALFFSAVVNSTEKAMSILPLLLIPQLLLSGFLKPVNDFYVNAQTRKPATFEDYIRFEDAKKLAGQPAPQEIQPQKQGAEQQGQRLAEGQTSSRAGLSANGDAPPSPPQPILKYTGLGFAKVASAVMMARWSTDGMVHAVSLRDTEARERLAAQMWVYSYARVLEGKSPSAIEDSYRARVVVNVVLLGGFILLFLGLTMVALRRKDIL